VVGNLCDDNKLSFDTSSPPMREELIERKFEFAGVSARYLFDMKKSEVIITIKNAFHRTSDIEAVREPRVGPASNAVINEIIITDRTSFIGVPMIVSDFAHKLIVERFGSDDETLRKSTERILLWMDGCLMKMLLHPLKVMS
jgi:hypothetical protein